MLDTCKRCHIESLGHNELKYPISPVKHRLCLVACLGLYYTLPMLLLWSLYFKRRHMNYSQSMKTWKETFLRIITIKLELIWVSFQIGVFQQITYLKTHPNCWYQHIFAFSVSVSELKPLSVWYDNVVVVHVMCKFMDGFYKLHSSVKDFMC